jgi:cobalt-zinc-cadmium resistance protein CzcA
LVTARFSGLILLMTCAAACVGLLPAEFSTAIGSQVQRPLAIVVAGVMLLAPLLFLAVLPAMIGSFSWRRVPATSPA